MPSCPAGVCSGGASALGALAGAAALTGGASLLAPTAAEATTTDPVAHLLRRTTYGMNADQIWAVRKMGTAKWLAAQMNPYVKVPDKAMDHLAITRYPRLRWEIYQVRDRLNNGAWEVMNDLVDMHIARAAWSSRQLLEVMVDFWSNHFNITCPSSNVWDSRARFDHDVIRTHAFGRFEDMLVASARHPAMLSYLNNASSTYKEPNENYGREVLELHTVGLSARYTEKDIHNSALIFTGMSIDGEGGGYLYKNYNHFVGHVQVLGFHDGNATASGGAAVAGRYLKYLAYHQATAYHLCGKLITRFVSDTPQPTLLRRLVHIYVTSGTAIKPVLLALFNSAEFKASAGLKTRTPFEDLIATIRALKIGPDPSGTDGIHALQQVALSMGHAPLGWSEPNGYPDIATSWASSSSTLGRWNAHMNLAAAWWPNQLSRVPLRHLLPAVAPMTVGQVIDLLAAKLGVAPLPHEHRSAIAIFLGRTTASRIADNDAVLGWRLPYIAALLLDSPAHVKR